MEQYVYIHEYADTYFMGQGNGEGGIRWEEALTGFWGCPVFVRVILTG